MERHVYDEKGPGWLASEPFNMVMATSNWQTAAVMPSQYLECVGRNLEKT